MLARPRSCVGDNAARCALGISTSDPFNEWTVDPLDPAVERASYLAARVSMSRDTVKRGAAALAGHSTPTSSRPERANGVEIVM
jgi:hypothetical protein